MLSELPTVRCRLTGASKHCAETMTAPNSAAVSLPSTNTSPTSPAETMSLEWPAPSSRCAKPSPPGSWDITPWRSARLAERICHKQRPGAFRTFPCRSRDWRGLRWTVLSKAKASERVAVDALARCLRVAEDVGIAAVIIDAKHEKAKAFYSHYEFDALPDQPLSLWLPLPALRKLLDTNP